MGGLKWVPLMALAVLPTAALAAPAASEPDEARALFKKGQAHYNVDQFPQAVDLFKQAYLLHPDPTFLYNIAQCHRKLGDVNEALSYFRKYLRMAPDASNRAEV